MYDMEMRDYDPAIARWVVQDPVVHYNYSPYNAFDNNPIYWTDPSGADSEVDEMGNAKRDRWGMYIPMNERSQENSFSISYDGKEDFLNKNNLYTFEEDQQNVHWEDKVDENSEIYRILKLIVKDPNSAAPQDGSSIQKLLNSKEIQAYLKRTNIKYGKDFDSGNLTFDSNAKIKDHHGMTYGDGDIAIFRDAFATWARLALTIIHEGVHKRELNKTWDPNSTLSTYNSEVRAWRNSGTLGDRAAEKMIKDYKLKIKRYMELNKR